ncbi:MAG: very short patch repair endonuclease [Pseudomonadota bacterium]
MDRITKELRSKIMSRVRTKDTAPELIVRRTLHAMGYRYRLHVKTLPGTPDIVFRMRKKAIFVHGCFWHGHDCRRGQSPKTNEEFWHSKIAKNRARDNQACRALEEQGWQVLIVWQCEIKDLAILQDRLQKFLEHSA